MDQNSFMSYMDNVNFDGAKEVFTTNNMHKSSILESTTNVYVK